MIQKSSNVGAARIALEYLDPHAMWSLFDGVGFGRVPRLGFPGEAAGQVRPYKSWRPIEQATMSYGHGIALSLVQLARAYTIFARDGELVPLSLVKLDYAPVPQQVLSEDYRARASHHARIGSVAQGHGAARADHRLSRRRQNRHGAQARGRRVRRRQAYRRRSSASHRRPRRG